MGRLHFKSDAMQRGPLELNWGVTRLGRGPANDFTIDHPTMSQRHCDVFLGEDGVIVRDCGSTNGTFIEGQRVLEARLEDGQTLRLGEVELVLQRDLSRIVVPELEVPQLAKSYHLADGGVSCLNHPQAVASYYCSHCRLLFCHECIHVLQREGGARHTLCPHCSGPCEPITFERREAKKSFFRVVREALRRPFRRGPEKTTKMPPKRG